MANVRFVWVQWSDGRPSADVLSGLSGPNGQNLQYIQTDTGVTTSLVPHSNRIAATLHGPTATATDKAMQHFQGLCASQRCAAQVAQQPQSPATPSAASAGGVGAPHSGGQSGVATTISTAGTAQPTPSAGYLPQHHQHLQQQQQQQWHGYWQAQWQAQHHRQQPGYQGWGQPPHQAQNHPVQRQGPQRSTHPPPRPPPSAAAAAAAATKAPAELGAMYIPTEFRSQNFIGPTTPWVIPKMEYSASAVEVLDASRKPPAAPAAGSIRFTKAAAPAEPAEAANQPKSTSAAINTGSLALTDVLAAKKEFAAQEAADAAELARLERELQRERVAAAAAAAEARAAAACREAELEATLAEYQTQLGEVQGLLETAEAEADGESGGAVELVEGLLELIAHTESELAELKVERSLANKAIQSAGGVGTASADTPQGNAAAESTSARSTPAHGGSGEGLADGNGAAAFTGDVAVDSRCAAPFMHDWGGGWTYHNAMITEVDPSGHSCTVLFTTPRHHSMVPCKSFFSGICTRDPCRFSHGHTVEASRLRDYTEPDFSALQVGCDCLVKDRTTDVWCDAVLLKQPTPSGTDHPPTQLRVRLTDTNTEAVVPFEDVLPIQRPPTHATDAAEGGSAHDAQAMPLGGDSDSDSDEFVPYGMDAEPTVRLAGWEQHTKGIGSRLLTRMGYVPGQGLGPRSDGRVDIVPVTVLPPGKSLDYCMDLKATGRLREGEPSKYRKRRGGGSGGGGGGGSGGGKARNGSSPGGQGIGATPANPEKLTKPKKRKVDARLALNAESLQLDSKIQKVRAGIKDRKGRVTRNPGLAAQLKPEIAALERALEEAEREAGRLQGRQRRDAERKKLVAF